MDTVALFNPVNVDRSALEICFFKSIDSIILILFKERKSLVSLISIEIPFYKQRVN